MRRRTCKQSSNLFLLRPSICTIQIHWILQQFRLIPNSPVRSPPRLRTWNRHRCRTFSLYFTGATGSHSNGAGNCTRIFGFLTAFVTKNQAKRKFSSTADETSVALLFLFRRVTFWLSAVSLFLAFGFSRFSRLKREWQTQNGNRRKQYFCAGDRIVNLHKRYQHASWCLLKSE